MYPKMHDKTKHFIGFKWLSKILIPPKLQKLPKLPRIPKIPNFQNILKLLKFVPKLFIATEYSYINSTVNNCNFEYLNLLGQAWVLSIHMWMDYTKYLLYMRKNQISMLSFWYLEQMKRDHFIQLSLAGQKIQVKVIAESHRK